MEDMFGERVGGAQIRTGHKGVSEVVLAVLIIFHVFPFEGVAPTTADSSGTMYIHHGAPFEDKV